MTPRERTYHRRKREGTNNLKPVFFKHRAVFTDGKKTEWFLDSEIKLAPTQEAYDCEPLPNYFADEFPMYKL